MGKGLIIVYTGNGKGKTTAALGLAFRTIGHRWKVCMIQFIKSKTNCGEHKIKKYLDKLYTFHVLGKGFILNEEDVNSNQNAARNAWNKAKQIISSNEYKLVILDELTYLISYNLIDEKEIIDFLINKPENMHIIVTGRIAPASLIDKADIVTEMREIKHYFNQGFAAQKGIEW